MSDKSTTVSHINSMGGCKSIECNSIPAPIFQDLTMYIASFKFTIFFNIRTSHRAECHCLSRHVLAVLRACQFACQELVGRDWPTKLALGIHESLRRFQLLSIKGLINIGPHSLQSFLQIRLQRYLYLT